MCSRSELRQLLHELLFRLDQVAYLGARTQFGEECSNLKTHNISAHIDKYHIGNGNARFENILRFQKAYIRYFVFASDPHTEFIVPLTSSSLALFITNILSQDGPTQLPVAYHTSRTIIEFLQVSSQCRSVHHVVHWHSTFSNNVHSCTVHYFRLHRTKWFNGCCYIIRKTWPKWLRSSDCRTTLKCSQKSAANVIVSILAIQIRCKIKKLTWAELFHFHCMEIDLLFLISSFFMV